MNLLYVIDSLAPYGAEQSLVGLTRAYRAAGLRVDVAYVEAEASLREPLEASGASVFWVGAEGRGAIAVTRRLARLIAERRPDLVHTTLYRADLVGRMAASVARVPVVSSLVSDGYGPTHRSDPSIRRWKLEVARIVDSTTARAVRRFHALTNHVARVMARRLHISGTRIDVVPRARDPIALGVRTADRRARVRRALGVRDEFVVLAVARQEYTKGLDVLLRAMRGASASFPDVRLLVAGRGGQQTPLLRELTDCLGLRDSATFLGPRGDVPDLLAAADVLALPSRAEGFAGTLVEAMALEAPIVASDLPAIREVVGGGDSSILVPPDDVRALERALVTSLSDGAGARDRAEAARARFLDRFTIDRVAPQMLAFYDRAMGARRVPSAA